ncbi:ribosome biogenesis GTPase YqeH [Tuanshanicoccus lijuaniae]|uniref:ribosome biogenesis GTPase YqeH n=1 Tax=Aerococcaceae bacterium zg-1292 TaxID=2774330 RepID=UPI001935F19D|nr:ribosome biogenesis GTPase YqeH [Aerococcaceae bacterium zg-1292]MBS4456433.1 ribosome biogenesis GTPase YqeH [Aerococcaceae bacterium zg-A91]MBS4458283.1 ribosome biogenesis GTPase YqeH [Aerococcaceae bacterium zg-BR33]QQA37485.1 ribosome biogenesis GTPase YqeH [Aerococcaceae bacterium zg-1292]
MKIGGTHLSENTYQCIGCGAMIQTTDVNAMGYLPNSALQKGIEKGEFYCQRCFRLRNYNELQDIHVSDDVFLEKLSQIAEDDALVVKVIDIFDVEGSMIHGLSRFIGNQPFVVLANKVDLLPKVTNQRRLKHWIKVLLNKNGLYPEDVLLASANKKQTLEPFIALIERVIAKKNVYIVGVTNVGKSTLINQLISYYGGEKSIITTSNHPGTTLDLIEIPMNEDHAIIDTPGIIRRSQLAHYLTRDEIRKVLPTKPLKPKTYQLNPEQTIFLGGLARVDFVKGQRAAMTFYVSNDLYIHRTKLAEANALYERHRGELLSPPSIERLDAFPPLVKKSLKLQANQDVAISGLGWLTTNVPVELDVWVPKGVTLLIREAII